jgi:hypothetical protein
MSEKQENKARQNVDYGYDIQRVYLEMMLADAGTFVRCQSIFDSKLFDRRLQEAAEFLTAYVSDNNVLPTPDIINAATGSTLKAAENLREEHFEWLMNDFETFTRHKGLERAILESADLLEKGEYGPVEEKIKQAVQVGLQRDMGTDYFKDPRARLIWQLRIKMDKFRQVGRMLMTSYLEALTVASSTFGRVVAVLVNPYSWLILVSIMLWLDSTSSI